MDTGCIKRTLTDRLGGTSRYRGGVPGATGADPIGSLLLRSGPDVEGEEGHESPRNRSDFDAVACAPILVCDRIPTFQLPVGQCQLHEIHL